jgi:hypothetical protein
VRSTTSSSPSCSASSCRAGALGGAPRRRRAAAALARAARDLAPGTTRPLTVADYHAAGGIDGAIERSAEQVYAALTAEEQGLVRQLFLRLVHLEGDTIATRRAATYEELDGLATGPTSLAGVLDRFVDARLLTAYGSTVEISHEALLAAWPRLRSWLEEDRETLRVHRSDRGGRQAWADSDRDPSTLARGVRLDAMREWLRMSSHRLVLSRLERDFLDASIAHAEAEGRRTGGGRDGCAWPSRSPASSGWSPPVRGRRRLGAFRRAASPRRGALPPGGADLGPAGRRRPVRRRPAGRRRLRDLAPTSEARAALLDAAAAPAVGSRILGGAGSIALAASEDGEARGRQRRRGATSSCWSPPRWPTARGLVAATVPLSAPDARASRSRSPPTARCSRSGTPRPDHAVGRHRSRRAGAPRRAAPRDRKVPSRGSTSTRPGPSSPPSASVTGSSAGTSPSRRHPSRCRCSRRTTSPGRSPTTPAGDHLVVGDETGAAVLWQLGDDPRPVATLPLSDRSTLAVAFAPDGTTVAAGSRTGELGVWELGDLDAADAHPHPDRGRRRHLRQLAQRAGLLPGRRAAGRRELGRRDAAVRDRDVVPGAAAAPPGRHHHGDVHRRRVRRSCPSRPTGPPAPGSSPQRCRSPSAARSGASGSPTAGASPRSPRSTRASGTRPTRGRSDRSSPDPRAVRRARLHRRRCRLPGRAVARARHTGR